MPEAAPSERTKLRRRADRGTHEREVINAILDAGLVCHVGFSHQGRPWVFPTSYARIDDHLYLHGASANFGLRTLAQGAEVCVTVTIIDGLVLARSAFHHSMNYRSVMVFGAAEAVTEEADKLAAMRVIVEHMAPGRWADTRAPSPNELRSTLVVRIPLTEASAKVRDGGPVEETEDIGLPYWAGVLPLALVPSPPLVDRQADDDEALTVPAYLVDWARPAGGAVTR